MIYFDYHATTPTDSRVAEKMLFSMTHDFGNAHSIDHAIGDCAESAVKTATQQIAKLIQAAPTEIIITSGATEGINLAIQGTIKYLQKSGIKPHIVISTVEHKAVLDTCHILESQKQIQLTLLPVNNKGNLDISQLDALCADGIHLLCIMAANNEVGTLTA